ncbi:MAG: UDP-N-acetylglucosamine 2-epimerase (non-hydrolyzing) [Ruminococcus flavefaciens]|nr:UDP-N-acetylglucosamine 2-epimerase (non-hydrolyzing) [Ruminococcus flavefaciens]
MNRFKVMTILGTRPDIIKLSCVIQELDKYTDHLLVHTGQNYDYELNEIFFSGLGLRKPDVFMDAAGATAAETIGNVIIRSDALIKEYKPDAVLIYGDTNSSLAIISAKRNKVPVFHMEAGNRCFDQRVPEELNRKIVDHLADINMVLTEHARRYLIAEGIPPETIIKTGSCMKQVIRTQMGSIDSSDVLTRLNLQVGEYFVISIHREENVDSEQNFRILMDTLNAVAKRYGKRMIVSTHPRTRKKLEQSGFHFSSLLEFMKPLSFADYIKLQKNAFCVVSDSGTITEESSLLKFPAISVRQAHERPEGMDEGTLIMSGLETDNVCAAIDCVTSQVSACPGIIRTVPDYEVDNVAEKVVRIILSYIGYVNRTVWRKYD